MNTIVMNKKVNKMTRQNKIFMVLFCLIVSAIFCIPFLNGHIKVGADTLFHINRIESLVNAINNGDIFPRIFFNQNYHYGYGSSLFYSFFFLYVPAFFRIQLGMNPIPAYKLFVFAIVFASSINIYYLTSVMISKKRNVYCMLASILYILNSFIMSDVYKRGAIGEALAYIFVPIVILAMYYLLYLNRSDKWWLLVIGFSGLVLSHNITFILMVVIFLGAIIMNIKKLLQNKKLIISIAVATVITILLTAFFTFPMLEQLQTGLYRVSDYFGESSIADQAINLHGLFEMSLSDDIVANNSIGLVLLFVPITAFFAKKDKNKTFVIYLTIVGYFLVFMCSEFFPWNTFTFLNFMQFPARVLIPACSLLTIGACYGLSNVKLNKKIKPILSLSILGITLLIMIVQIFMLYSNFGMIYNDFQPEDLNNDEVYYGDRHEWYSIVEVSSPDYIMINSDIHFFDAKRTITTNNEETNHDGFDNSEYNHLIFTIGSIKEGAYYTVPLSYYKGYKVDVYENNTYVETLDTYPDPVTGLVTFNPTPYDGGQELKFDVVYKGTDVQHISMAVSIVTFWMCVIALVVYLVIQILAKFGIVTNFSISSIIKHNNEE